MKPKLLDLFCGAGGCSMGYHQAGFEVVGVDVKFQNNYPFEFLREDVLWLDPNFFEEFDVIHASPPCQCYSMASKRYKNAGKNYPDLIKNTREVLMESGKLWVIENVKHAPLISGIRLCGTSFGLKTGNMELQRHRYFETYPALMSPPCQHSGKLTVGVYGNGTPSWHRKRLGRNIHVSEWREAMGIDWMTRKELTQAIPPAYTKWIGEQLMEHLRSLNDKNFSDNFDSRTKMLIRKHVQKRFSLEDKARLAHLTEANKLINPSVTEQDKVVIKNEVKIFDNYKRELDELEEGL